MRGYSWAGSSRPAREGDEHLCREWRVLSEAHDFRVASKSRSASTAAVSSSPGSKGEFPLGRPCGWFFELRELEGDPDVSVVLRGQLKISL
jgi:hypothetical protein